MIHTDTDGGVIGFTDVQEGNEAVAYLPDLLRVLLIGIFQMLEGACGIHVVARVDADLFRILRGNVCYFRVEMYVCHQWHHVAVLAQGGIDVHQVLRFLDALGGEAYVFSAGIHNTFGLCHTRIGILRGGIGHALYADRIGAAHRGGSDIHF